MAVSAFRSTTKRKCQIGSAEGSVPSTPRSKQEPSPGRASHGRGSHRRSSSLTDFGPKYFSDYSSNLVKRGGRRSVCPSDDESDMDCISVHQRQRRRDADSEDERVTIVNIQHDGLRRKSSSQDLIQQESKLHHFTPSNDIEGDDTREIVEEKTISPVYAQMKSLRMNPPIGDFGTSDVLDAMKSEVRSAVAEIRTELEKSMQKNCKSFQISNERSLAESQGTDVIQAVLDIRKEYSTRLEQSEKRVQELRPQLAIEEHRCLEPSKIVKELLLAPPSSAPHSFTAPGSSNRKKSHKRRNSAEKQLVSMSLDDEAFKYFEECASLSPLDCRGNSDDSSHGIDQQIDPSKDGSSKQITRGKERLAMALDEDIAVDTANLLQEDGKLKSCLVGSDGVVLPWLQWEAEGEAEAGLSDKHLKKFGKRHISSKSRSSLFNRVSTGSSNPFYSSSHVKGNMPKKSTSSVQGSINVGLVSHTASLTTVSGGGSDKLMRERIPDNPVSILHASLSSRFSLTAVDERKAQKVHHFPDLDTLMLERIRLSVE